MPEKLQPGPLAGRISCFAPAFAQVVYLVMFSYAFFLKGFTGLAITIGSVATLFVAMQVTGRIRWADRFSLKPPEQPAPELS